MSVDVDAASLAKRTAGFSGAELANLVNEAALSAGKGGLPQITSALLDDAQDKVLMGSERRCAISFYSLGSQVLEICPSCAGCLEAASLSTTYVLTVKHCLVQPHGNGCTVCVSLCMHVISQEH